MWGTIGRRNDDLSPIKITRKRLFGLLRERVGKKEAKAMAYGRVFFAPWKRESLQQILGNSHNLKDIRIMYLFGCRLTARQQVILMDNGQKYHVIDYTAVRRRISFTNPLDLFNRQP